MYSMLLNPKAYSPDYIFILFYYNRGIKSILKCEGRQRPYFD